jgi:hypothetical protein
MPETCWNNKKLVEHGEIIRMEWSQLLRPAKKTSLPLSQMKFASQYRSYLDWKAPNNSYLVSSACWLLGKERDASLRDHPHESFSAQKTAEEKRAFASFISEHTIARRNRRNFGALACSLLSLSWLINFLWVWRGVGIFPAADRRWVPAN